MFISQQSVCLFLFSFVCVVCFFITPSFWPGFAIGAAFQRYQFERSLGALIQRWLGHRPALFTLAFMGAGVILSGFISNIAGSVLLQTVVLPIVHELPLQSAFVRCLLLSLAFSCNIGGMLTPIAAPQNLVALDYLEKLAPQYKISFLQWFAVGLPFCLVALVVTWGLLYWMMKPTDIDHVPRVDFEGGPWRAAHYAVLALSALTILLWITFTLTSSFFGDMATVALIPVIVFFAGGFLKTSDFNNFQWHLIFLLGGGNLLGFAMNDSGLLTLAANAITPLLQDQSTYVIVLAFTGIMLVIATFVSHSQSAIILFPIIIAMGKALGHVRYIVMAAALMNSGYGSALFIIIIIILNLFVFVCLLFFNN
jgi:phosphate transporter